MKRIVFLLVATTVFACQPKKDDAESTNDTTANEESTLSAVADNTLTEDEKSQGWKLLFNGENTDGWKIFKNKENNSWEVADGKLHCKPFDGSEKRSDIMTTDQYQNFELMFDWKISQQGNSGVMFRVTEEYNEPYFSGPEYQVIDDKGYPGNLQKSQLAGSNYDMHAAPEDKPIKAVGEWNTSKLVVNGDHVEHWLNGTKLLEYDLNSSDWKQRKANSKWKDEKGYGMSKIGYIDFQDHGNEVWYRNIKIRVL